MLGWPDCGALNPSLGAGKVMPAQMAGGSGMSQEGNMTLPPGERDLKGEPASAGGEDKGKEWRGAQARDTGRRPPGYDSV